MIWFWRNLILAQYWLLICSFNAVSEKRFKSVSGLVTFMLRQSATTTLQHAGTVFSVQESDQRWVMKSSKQIVSLVSQHRDSVSHEKISFVLFCHLQVSPHCTKFDNFLLHFRETELLTSRAQIVAAADKRSASSKMALISQHFLLIPLCMLS